MARKQKFSAQVVSRLRFARELLKDGQNQPRLFDDETLKNLIQRKADAAKQREQMVKSCFLPLLAAYALTFGFSISIPGFQVNLEFKNHLIGLLACLASISLLQIFIWLDTEQTYDGLIDQFIIEKSHRKFVDPDVLKAAYQTQYFFFKTLRKQFNLYAPDSIRFKRMGSSVHAITLHYIGSIWGFLFLAVYAALIYLTIVVIPNDIIGWIMKLVCWANLLGAVLIEKVPNVEFEIVDDWGGAAESDSSSSSASKQ